MRMKVFYGPDEKIPGEKHHDRCAYKNCKNGKYRMGGRKLFAFPSCTDGNRREIWLNNCGNDSLRNRAESVIRRSGICADHFEPSAFTCEKKIRITRRAVPLPNYPPDLTTKVWPTSPSALFVDDPSNYQGGIKTSNSPSRVPRLFEDDEVLPTFYDLEPIGGTSGDEMEISHEPDIPVEHDPSLFNDTSNTNNEKVTTDKPESEVAPSSPKSLPSTNQPESNFDFSILNTTMTAAEIIRRLSADIDKDRMVEKLTTQNALLRQEVRKLKVTVRRLQQPKTSEPRFKRLSLKRQKKEVLNMVKYMDLPPFAKAVISLQLHNRNTPYTEDEKNVARAFQQHSRADLKRLRKVGCSFPSRSTIQRWMSENNVSECSSASSASKDEENSPDLEIS